MPRLDRDSGPLYREIVERLADDIRTGRLSEGARLPTMRDLAAALKVTVGTVNRAYGLAERRGLLVKRVGQGSFVSAGSIIEEVDDAGAGDAVDLSLNRPAPVPLSLRPTLNDIGRECEAQALLDYGPSQGRLHHREIISNWVEQRGVTAGAERIILTNGAQQALMVALGTLARPGDTVLVESLTYPGVKNLARLFGLRLLGLSLDEEGIKPDAFEAVCARHDARLLFCMPWAHNPTTRTLSAARREQLAAIAARAELILIEEDVYDHGERDLPALSALYPRRSIYIGSLSKIVAPGLRLGYMLAPATLIPDLVAVTQATSLMVSPVVAELACRWIADGAAAEIAGQRRQAAHSRQAVAAECLQGLAFEHDTDNTHLWLRLPPPWTGPDFCAKAAEHNVIVTPGEQFAVTPGADAAAIRLCLGAPNSINALRRGLAVVADLAMSRPGPVEFRL